MRHKRTLLICILVLSSLQVNASVLIKYLKNLNSFQAEFIQTVFTETNDKKQKSSGFIVVKSPNQFFLKYIKPYKLVYVADGKKIWSYDKDLEQVVVKKQGDILVNTPVMLLGNPKDLTRSYRIEEMGLTDGWLWFELTPKEDDTNFETVALAFENKELRAMEMTDHFGQTTRLEFINIIKNPKLAKNQFKFVPPKGVDVIGQ